MRSASRLAILASRALVVAAAVLAGSDAGQAEEFTFCSDRFRDETLSDAELSLQDGVDSDVKQAVSSVEGKAEAEATRLQERADSDGTLGGAKSDVLRKMFALLDLGDVSEEDDSLIFNFSPDRLRWVSVGTFAPRVIVRTPAVFEPFGKKLDELDGEDGVPTADDFEKEFDDLDDVEYQLRWSWEGESAAQQVRSRTEEVAELAAQAFEDAYGTKTLPTERFAELAGKIGEAGLDPESKLSVLCGDSRGRMVVQEFERHWRERFLPALGELKAELVRVGFYRAAELVDGESKLLVTATARERRGAAGPDQIAASVRYELSRISLRAWKKWSAAQGRALDLVGLGQFVDERRSTWRGRLGFSLAIEYTDVDDFRIAISDSVAFEKKGQEAWSAKAAVGTSFDPEQTGRIDLALAFEDATDDPERDDRFVGSLTWTQKLSDDLAKIAGGSSFVATLVYANEPKYRGDVDEELSLRAGLKWSFGDKKKDEKEE